MKPKYLTPSIIYPVTIDKKAKFIELFGTDHRGNNSSVLIKPCDLNAIIKRLRELKGKSDGKHI